jgi:N-acetylneuraminic acid mutarotase
VPRTLQIAPTGWSLPSPRDREVALADGTGVVVLGGRDAAKQSRTSVLRLDPGTGKPTELGDLAVAVHDAAGAVIGGQLVVFGGGGATTVDSVQSLTPGSGTRVIAHLPRPRSDLATASVDGTVYVVGGFDGARMTPEVLATTDALAFAPVANLPVPVRYPAVAGTGGHVYVIGGVTGTSEASSADSPAIQDVDVAAHTARVVGQLPQTLAHATAVVLRGEVYVLGGRLAGRVTDQVWHLDTHAATLVAAGRLPLAVSDSAAAVVGDRAYVLGGEVTAPVAAVSVLGAG